MVSPLMAARAYAQIQNPTTDEKPRLGGAGGPDFASLVTSAVNDAVAGSRRAETQMTAHAQGKAELVDVVTAVASAQASLETMMAVRDQVIAAYQEIMRMPI